ncbi:GNAT family N-acetyltransferase [Acaryochloris sp. IP29b_bin.137]|uniref:GNAT family N-acetyltransferase n=1 Tax=Acaryochloris sp. IP29b_bin.137 TaxID=2969217 RepID=UPI00263940F5|nr:GNAT family N-acetyltransferase [Acaryochloris sp. IP29b_bin.137]
MNLNIRLVGSEEMEQVLDIQRQAIQNLCSKDYNPHQVDAIVRSQHKWRGTYERIYVAEKDQALVGFIAVSPCKTNIAGLYVHPDHTRQGIATQLLQYFERLAIENKRHRIWVTSSLTAVALYQSQGYVGVGKTKINALGISIPCLFMEKYTSVPPPQYPLGIPLAVLWVAVLLVGIILLLLR